MSSVVEGQPAKRAIGLPPHFELIAGLGFIFLALVAGLLMPLPYDPVKPDGHALTLPPSSEHWFGTDANGFDVLSRTIAAARRDLPLSLAGTLISVIIGVPLGLFASAKTAWGNGLMRALDLLQAFPLLVLSITLVTITGNHLQNVVLALALINVPRFMRLVRSEALSLRESRFIEAAEAIGASPLRVMFGHILPNVTGLILAQCSLAAGYAMIIIASLSFLGIGVTVPEPTWGSMIQAGARSISQGQWWMSLFPGIAVFLIVFAFNAVADGLAALLDPRRR